MKVQHTFGIIIILLCTMMGCKHTPETPRQKNTSNVVQQQNFDLPDIENAGELIAVTLSGPESYYTSHGREMGLQYALAEDFANTIGMRLRIEIAHDSTELISMLKNAKVDLIAYPVSAQNIGKEQLTSCGYQTDNGQSWAVRQSSPLLLEAINDWYTPQLIVDIEAAQKQLKSTPYVIRKARAPYLSKAKGRISAYDHLFVKYGHPVGYDWRMLAALCYQESSFDPQATSWVGAKGLMQIMPKTAVEMGINPSMLTDPETNIATSVRYLRKVEQGFRDIESPNERIKFTLAGYNGGTHHIRDAMRLAQKNRRNPHIWANVAPFVLHLSEPQYYRDPVVKNGYMIGSETYNYVNNIISRWNEYSGVINAPSFTSEDLNFNPERASRKNRFVKPQQILTPDDSIFSLD